MINEWKPSNNGVEYYGIFLDEKSKEILKRCFVPQNAVKIYCDHMTIARCSQFTDEIIEKCEYLVGKQIPLYATSIGISEDVVAVGIETDCFSVNKHKHITLCTLNPSAKPVQSNYITDWRSLEKPILLNGVVRGFKKRGLQENDKKKRYVRQDIMLNATTGDCCMEEQINEVESDDINLKSFEVKDELNPKFWINDKINSRVRLKLLDLADEFYDSLNIKWVKPKDIVLTGSIANYNWSKYSDVDVHILVDYKSVWKKTDFVEDYFNSKKALWLQEHGDLKIYGFPVEMYVEDSNKKNHSSGVYSLNKNKWIVEPNDFQDADLNEDYIKERSAKIITKIDDIENTLKKEKDNHKLEMLSTKIKKLFDKLHKQRKESLNKHGEMGTYNIIWKVLRRTGYLDKMWDIINTIYNKVNSIKENKKHSNSNKLNEAMKDSFDFTVLENCKDYGQMVNYCREQLGPEIGRGSSRMIFQIDDEHCLKLAYNEYGLQQNKVEEETKFYKSPLFPYIIDSSIDYLWIVSEVVLPAEEDDVEHCLGMDCEKFFNIIKTFKRTKRYPDAMQYAQKFMDEDKTGTLRHLYDYIITYDIPICDMLSLENWGMTRRNGKDYLVLLDAGWNKETLKMYGWTPSA